MLKTLKPMQRDAELWQDYENKLLEGELEPLLFFYTWDKACISVGKAQKANIETELEIVSRPTGGRAVLHGSDICYTFIASQKDKDFGGNLKESFCKVNRYVFSLIKKLAELEEYDFGLLEGTCAEDRDKVSANRINCFSSTLTGEALIEANGREHKILGAAQAMGQRAFIQQGSLQLNKAASKPDIFSSSLSLEEITGQAFDLSQICEKLNHEQNRR